MAQPTLRLREVALDVPGAVVVIVMCFGWFGTVIRESEAGKYNTQVDRSYRWAMGWFIFSEVMFFAAFFGALFYVRQYAGPWLGGAGNNAMTNELLWKGFEFTWPMTQMPDATGFDVPKEIIGAWGIPALNTLILLLSGVTVTIAHHGLKKNHRGQLILWHVA